MRDLHRIEETLQRLKPPAWPEALLGNIDKPFAAKGRELFAVDCAGCHVPRVTQSDGRPVQHLKLLPVEVIGKDPGAANNIADYRFDLTVCSGIRQSLRNWTYNCIPTPQNPWI